ncbi:Zinc finger CCCH domain-containing 15 [Melia azedarach]|uniref:Zinc finger CCCH domain-containing 15 n=1 Tax=Melia azedarach TaxID=155640 RepID=A0ACC1WQ34_MELAZ|nr:Zinc finger CCCH domain-containing 15 [Melia azedarach]
MLVGASEGWHFYDIWCLVLLSCCVRMLMHQLEKLRQLRNVQEDIAAGTVQMNGRELFLHEPWVFDNTHY